MRLKNTSTGQKIYRTGNGNEQVYLHKLIYSCDPLKLKYYANLCKSF